MDNRKRLAYAIVRFLQDQLRHGGLSSDAQESLEVAIQCLETAFGVTAGDSDLALPRTLPEIFEAAATGREMPQDLRSPARTPPSEEDSAEAERLKTEGNEQMKVENFEAAVHFYGKAIELNPSNAVYFCNRAAAYSKLGNYAGAVRDCERAICIDPAYSKAYGRMGGVRAAWPPGRLMSGMISGGHNPLGTPGTSPSQNDLASLIQAGQQFAQQMQQQNPELIEQLRSQVRSRTPSASNEEQQE
ncbi:Small glutamine-rich tetratricopeptide repeat-containing protein alpha [Tupaia chinensis]|uniref:Small glutamine-rich tetratricopeptide repeat-containing protein alpha n=1 Tax=Tupaia chinensis TaxID=246437 RepID=L8Y2V0_TUPCH|nr:Small glutamine-rich tetratricopeptide repeat-containing protein alpha [Tupaia chinensis]